MPTTQQLVDQADRQIRHLQSVERDLTSAINGILDIEFERPLSKAERARVLELRQAKVAALSAMEELGFMTLQALDQAPEIERLRKSIARVRADLAQGVKRVKSIGTIATTIARVLSGLETLVDQLDSFVPANA